MIIICAWCSKNEGEKQPLENKEITHSICQECSEQLTKETNEEIQSNLD